MSRVIIDCDVGVSFNTMTVVKGSTMILHHVQQAITLDPPANNNPLMRDVLKLKRKMPMATMRENRGAHLHTNEGDQ